MQPDLISLTEFPTMPALFSSDSPGEAWVWGDFFATLQTRPKLIIEAVNQVTGQKPSRLPPLEYPFAMSVFYRKDKNPHGPSSRPVLVATLERMTLSPPTPIVRGCFKAGIRMNQGTFEEELTQDNARRALLAAVRQSLGLSGEPVKIGTIADVYGHPNTVWPAQKKAAPGGCLTVLAVVGACLSVLLLAASLLISN